jgi:hypothetical protein
VCRRIEPNPFITLINDSNGPFSNGCPDAAQYRLEAEASLVRAPDFYLLAGMRLLQSLGFER